MRVVDDMLNQITMYRLMLYYLVFLVLVASVLGLFGFLPFTPISILSSMLFLVIICVISNKILASIFKAPTNIESSYITALILCLIITPASKPNDFLFLFLSGIIAMAGKYILFWKRKHIFNPAAAGVVTTSLLFGWYASWWVGTLYMFPALLLGAFVVRKIKRSEQIFAYFAATIITMLVSAALNHNDFVLVLKNALLESPILFFAFVMLTEPLTSPTRRTSQIIYGIIVGILVSSELSFMGYYLTPEIALLVGNVFAYSVNMKQRLVLRFKNKILTGINLWDFTFLKPNNFSFTPGQYMEWTLAHKGVDSRGNRRYFTIASSPTENALRIGVRISDHTSSFKYALSNLDGSTQIVAGQLGGDFVLPKDSSIKLAFIAGGIGITPFRSMIKYLIDKKERRDIVLFYANKSADEIVYKEIFDEAAGKFGLKTIYVLGRMSSETIKKEVPDYNSRTFYLSGPHAMVDAYKLVLKEMKVPARQIITDYFPGYA